MSDVFISYTSEDRQRVVPLVRALQQKGWSVWWDRVIPPGKTWDQVIQAEIEQAHCVIVLWSEKSVKSNWVIIEAEEARHRGVLVPALLDQGVALPLAFRRIQAANLVDWHGEISDVGFEELAQAVSEKMSGLAIGRSNVPLAPSLPSVEKHALKSEPAENPHTGVQGLRRNALQWTLITVVAGSVMAFLTFQYSPSAVANRVLAETGNAHYMTVMGNRYLNGDGVAKSYDNAMNWFRKATESGDADGASALGSIYLNGWGVKEDDFQAERWYRRAAEAGNAAAMKELGDLYDQGRGVTQNESAAENWYRKAVQTGDPGAMGRLGMIYEFGLGEEKDDGEAVTWYRRAAQAGDTFGMTNLGNMLRYGQGVSQDHTQAAAMYRRAADAGNERAMACLGTMYLYGLGVAKDEGQAMIWLRRTKYPEAVRDLAVLKLKQNGTPENEAGSLSQLLNSAVPTNATEMALIGDLYQHGIAPLPKDEVRAAKCYRIAAEAGDELGMLSLGAMYEHGLGGLVKDRDLAKLWYGKALGQERDNLDNGGID